MKRKAFGKKLTLKKETVADLPKTVMVNVKGGTNLSVNGVCFTKWITCHSCYETDCFC